MRKHQLQNEGFSTKYMTSTFQNCQSHEKQRLKICQIEEDKEDMMTKCNIGFQQIKDTNGKRGIPE